MTLLFYLTVLPLISAFPPFDFIEDALIKYVNKSVDPCDNFYRHACSFDSPDGVANTAFQELFSYLEDVQKDSYWNHLLISKENEDAFETGKTLYNADSMINLYSETFDAICNVNEELALQFIDMIRNTYKDQTEKTRIYFNQEQGNRNYDKNCSTLSNDFKKELNELIKPDTKTIRIVLKTLKTGLSHSIRLLKGISALLSVDVRHGIELTRDMLNDSLAIAEELVKDTPWAIKLNIVEAIENITSHVAIHDNYGSDLIAISNSLFAIEKQYIECKNKYSFLPNVLFSCNVLSAVNYTEPNIRSHSYDLVDNAFNAYSVLYFGYPIYYYAQYGREMASKLGYTGFTVGHEMSHTFFDKHDKHQYLPEFSEKVEKCVQNQYNSTCNEYREASCATKDVFLEENGADIFGLQIAYKLMEKYYQEKLGDKIDRLNITNEQLFFYAHAFGFCSGELSRVYHFYGYYEGHSANNIRVNVAAQVPAFQKAFKCSPDSRMMKSATNQCFIYGSEAPDSKRRLKDI